MLSAQIQLLTDLAFLALGIAGVAAAMRRRERTRIDIAILFGDLALSVLLQEISLLTCRTPSGCLSVPLSRALSTILVLAVPYAMLRLVDDIYDVPSWQMWVSLVGLITLG